MSVKSLPANNIKEWRTELNRLQGAYADGTLRAYQADIEAYERWCHQRQLSLFPAQPVHLAEFLRYEAERSSAATIKRRLAAIGKIHRLMKLDNPILDEDVSIALRRELRKKASRPKQALGMTYKIRERLIAACDSSLIGKRDRAIIALGYDTLSRRSEIVSINLEDITANINGAKVIIRRSKNDQYGAGRVANISPRACKILEDWLKSAGITHGAVFRSIKSNRIGTLALHPHSISRIVKLAARRAGFSHEEVRNLSSHSMRIGAAQDMMTAGLDILPIMAAGGWRTTNVVARYVENADISQLLRSSHK